MLLSRRIRRVARFSCGRARLGVRVIVLVFALVWATSIGAVARRRLRTFVRTFFDLYLELTAPAARQVRGKPVSHQTVNHLIERNVSLRLIREIILAAPGTAEPVERRLTHRPGILNEEVESDRDVNSVAHQVPFPALACGTPEATSQATPPTVAPPQTATTHQDTRLKAINRQCCVGRSDWRQTCPMTSVAASAFAGYRFPREVISVAVRWYLRYSLSYRDVEELLAERGVDVDHVTVYRWVQRFTPEFVEAARPRRHVPSDRWLVDETYAKVNGRWTYLYRAIDQHGQVIDVWLSAKRDLAAARTYFPPRVGHRSGTNRGDHRPRIGIPAGPG
jgi:hypothetical protein